MLRWLTQYFMAKVYNKLPHRWIDTCMSTSIIIMFADKLVNITCITSIYVSEVNEVLCSSENYISRNKNQQKCYYIIILYFVNKIIA